MTFQVVQASPGINVPCPDNGVFGTPVVVDSATEPRIVELRFGHSNGYLPYTSVKIQCPLDPGTPGDLITLFQGLVPDASNVAEPCMYLCVHGPLTISTTQSTFPVGTTQTKVIVHRDTDVVLNAGPLRFSDANDEFYVPEGFGGSPTAPKRLQATFHRANGSPSPSFILRSGTGTNNVDGQGVRPGLVAFTSRMFLHEGLGEAGSVGNDSVFQFLGSITTGDIRTLAFWA